MPEPSENALENGIAVIHANQLEALRDVVVYWLRQHPLSPLENEVVLVQSNGMGQWLKQNLALNNAAGIAAAMQIQLPSLFIWSAYRAVLGQQIPKEQPLAKAPLTWRLYRLLPNLITQSDFLSLKTFLQNDTNSRKRFQLAEQLADLFDQYQVYRSDWVSDWASGNNCLRNAHAEVTPLSESDGWQAALWRTVLADLGFACNPFASRASVHAQFMTGIDELNHRPAGLPRRIILFGLSSLPQQSLEALAKLGRFCQIVLFVHNPCQHYWADIIEDKELLKAQRRRQNYKSGMPTDLGPEQLHSHTHPLLAAWGKQGRDYIRLLDQFDETQAYQNWHWPQQKIDLFADYGEAGQRTILQQIQQSILDLEPIPSQAVICDKADDSLVFHIAHSPQREMEILHDQLLARFNQAAQTEEPLFPRDIIVMVPDINQYAPHIRAVFGRIQSDDPRYIPYSLADQQQRGENSLLLAVETLLNLPDSRFKVSEIMGLLEVPALRQRFEISETAIPKLQQWLEQSGIRWGLNAKQRADTSDMRTALDANTWQFGLQRMLLGYAVGDAAPFNGIEPYPEIGGLEAQWLGNLCHFLQTLEDYAQILAQQLSALAWQQCLSQLLDDFFAPEHERDSKILELLNHCLQDWQQACSLGGLIESDTLPLNVVREAWLSSVDEPKLQQRFLSGKVNFCTLMPMRAIPFRMICLLGMNDGDYPRNQYAHGFDLMSRRGYYRPGDRSRRQDDQYLFLEALLSARQYLYLSWVGRSIRDNSVRQPSVLVAQLRDYLRQSRCLAGQRQLLDALTLEHPLQPFSTEYIKSEREPGLFTYSHEWFQVCPPNAITRDISHFSSETSDGLTVEALAAFLRAPVKTFCQQSLKFSFDSEAAGSQDDEPFCLDRLQTHRQTQVLLNALLNQESSDGETFYAQQQASLSGQGLLPLAGFAAAAFNQLVYPVDRAWQRYQTLLTEWSIALDPKFVEVSFKLGASPELGQHALANEMTIKLSTELSCCRQTQDLQKTGLLHLSAQTLLQKDNLHYHRILFHWLQHLLACADGTPMHSYIIAADCVLEILPIATDKAHSYLQTLLLAWQQGLQAPLPVACRTAFVWLTAPEEKALIHAEQQYGGDDWNRGEVDFDRYLARFFPDFVALFPDFALWSDKLYRPLTLHIRQVS